MTIPPYTARFELDASGAPVVALEPVVEAAPNRGTENLADSLDHLALLLRAHQSLSFGSSPRMVWDASTASLTLDADLVIRYTVDDPTDAVPIVRTLTLRKGTWQFSGARILVAPLGFDANVTVTPGTPGGTPLVTPSSAGSARYLSDDGEAQQFYRTETATNGRQSALKHVQVARVVGTSLHLLGSVVLRDGVAMDAWADEGYSGDATTAETRRLLNQDRNVSLYGGGVATFVAPTGTTRQVSTTADVSLVVPGNATTVVKGLTSGVTLTATNPVLIVQINRTSSSSAENTASAANWSSLGPGAENLMALGYWDAVEDVFRWFEGTGYRVGDTYPIGLNTALTASYVIETILPEMVYDSDADAHAGLTGLAGASDRVAFVVSGADREIVRVVSQDSITASGAGGDPVEVYRGRAVRVRHIEASAFRTSGERYVRVVVPGTTTLAHAEVDSLSANQIRATNADTLLVMTGDGVHGPGSLVAGSVRGLFEVVTGTIKSDGTRVVVQTSAGADSATLRVSSAEIDRIKVSGAVRVENTADNTLRDIEARAGILSQYVRVDGSGLSEPQVRTAGTEVAFRDTAGVSLVDTRAKWSRARALILHSTDSVTGLGSALLQAGIGQLSLVDPATTLPTLNFTSLRVEAQTIGTLLNTRSYVRITDRAGSNLRDVYLRHLYAENGVRFAAPETLNTLQLSRGSSTRLDLQDGSSGDYEALRLRALELHNGAGTQHVLDTYNNSGTYRTRLVWGPTRLPLEVEGLHVADAAAPTNMAAMLKGGRKGYGSWNYLRLREDNDTAFAYLMADSVVSRNTNLASGRVHYDSGAAAWEVNGGTGPVGATQIVGVTRNVNELVVETGFELGAEQYTAVRASGYYEHAGTRYPVVLTMQSMTPGPRSEISFHVHALAAFDTFSVGDQITGSDIERVVFSVDVTSNLVIGI